ncbi:MAG: uracil-xanthine permease family protein [Treponemataceae bacterium]
MKVEFFKQKADTANIYKLDGRVPIRQAIPFGFQHVLAMFVPNIAPILIIVGAANASGVMDISTVATGQLIQTCMFIAGIATLIQLYSIKGIIGSRLPVVMGISFTFLGSMIAIVTTSGFSGMAGAVLIGGIFEGLLGLSAKYWRRIFTPVVTASVVTAIGFSLLSVGARSFGGGYVDNFGASHYWAVSGITLVTCFLVNIFAKGVSRQLNILYGLIAGYITALIIGFVNPSLSMISFAGVTKTIEQTGFFSFPRILPYGISFDIGSIISVCVVFLVSAAETIGDTTALVSGGLNRKITEKEIAGSLSCDGFLSSISGLLGCTPITSFSQNVGLINMTKVVNRYSIMFGALLLILAGIFPPVGALLATIPDPVLGGCTVIMFGTIIASGIQMLAKAGFTQRNILIVALSLSVGIGFTLTSGIYSSSPQLVQDIFASNPVAGVFLISLILSLVLPKDMEVIPL